MKEDRKNFIDSKAQGINGGVKMSDREKAIHLLEKLPDNKIAYVIGYMQGLTAEKNEIEEVEPDEWDLAMIKESRKENDGKGIEIEDLAAELGITL